MKFTKTIAAIIMLSIYLCPNFSAVKNSKLGLASKTATSYDYLTIYKLNRLCDDIITEPGIYGTETLILITADLCRQTFTNIKKILSNKEVAEDSYYILDILSYMETVTKINNIIFDMILKPDGDKKVLPPFKAKPTNATKQSLNRAFFTVSSALRKYENIFTLQLGYELKNHEIIRRIHDKMCRTWDGLWSISESSDFKD